MKSLLNNNKDKAAYVLRNIKEYGEGMRGHLVTVFNVDDGSVVDSSPIFEDFGDIAPFFWLTGGHDLVNSEFSALTKQLEQDELLVNVSRQKPWLVNTYDWTDLLLGLIEYHQLSRNRSAIEHADRILFTWADRFYRNGRVSGKALKAGKCFFPLPVMSLLDIGMFPELLISRMRLPKSARSFDYYGCAQNIVRAWLEDDFFSTTGLFPDFFISPYLSSGLIEEKLFTYSVMLAKRERTQTATLFKHNTNALASVLSLYKETKDPLYKNAMDKWYKSCIENLVTDKNMVSSKWRKRPVAGPTDHNFQVIDLMCDIAYETQDQSFLSLAIDVANSWLEHRGKTGLIPHCFEGEKAGLGMSDSQTDFAVAFLKLYALAGKSQYKQAAFDLMEAVNRYMYKPRGMVTWVDVETGAPANNLCKTKFFALSLKGWIALDNYDKIYKDMKLTAFLHDR